MKKKYISPCQSDMMIDLELLLSISAKIGGDANISFGGDDNEGYEGEVKENSFDLDW